jgi:hypothetical protein
MGYRHRIHAAISNEPTIEVDPDYPPDNHVADEYPVNLGQESLSVSERACKRGRYRRLSSRADTVRILRTGWWWTQSGANRSPSVNSLLCGKIQGNYAIRTASAATVAEFLKRLQWLRFGIPYCGAAGKNLGRAGSISIGTGSAHFIRGKVISATYLVLLRHKGRELLWVHGCWQQGQRARLLAIETFTHMTHRIENCRARKAVTINVMLLLRFDLPHNAKAHIVAIARSPCMRKISDICDV